MQTRACASELVKQGTKSNAESRSRGERRKGENDTRPETERTASTLRFVSPAALAAQVTPQLNTSGQTLTIVVPLKDGEVYLGDVEVRVAPDDSIEVAADQVFALLAQRLEPSAIAPLQSLAGPGAFVPLAQFASAGAPLSFNPRTLELDISLPAAVRARQSIGLADLDRSIYGEFVAPEAVSAYVNIRAAVDYVHEGFSGNGFSDPLFLFDGATRLGPVVLESEASWNERDFRREGTRFVYDDIERLNRWTLGDLLPQGRGFQGVDDVAGLGLERSYGLLDPQRNTTPRGGRTFTLDREATVEAYINGRVIRTIRLQPGTYDVSNFPFIQGSNDVDLVISDSSGRRDVISFSLFIDRSQLGRGLSEYGAYIGVDTDRVAGSIDYSNDFAMSGFYRRGVTDDLTLGANLQHNQGGSLFGTELVWGSPIGTFGADFGYSDLDSVGDGWAANISFERLVQSAAGGGASFVAALEARSRRFGPPSLFAPDNAYAYNLTVGYTRAFADNSFASVQLRYANARSGFADERSARVSYGRRLTSTVNFVLDLDWAEGGFADGTSFRVSLVRRFGTSGSARAEYDSRAERGRFGYQTSGGRGVGAWSASGSLDGGSDDLGFNGAAAYAANRAELGIGHSTAYSQTTDDITDQRTYLRAGTSIAFAGGHIAIGRPISDSFVIARPYNGDPDIVVEVEPSPDGFDARSGTFGPALYGQVSSYSPRSVIFDAAQAPPGFDIGSGSLRLLAPYRAGYLVNIGSDYGVTVVGRLIDVNGDPLTLLSGVAIEQGENGRRIEVFTNRQGLFGASGLRAGVWRIEMIGSPPSVYELVVPDTSDGVARVGDLRPTQ
ncbi:MAG: fimbrial biogenesis outer membrane usher protein [Caulobacterales bacterium]|nr:fimbrial biogenesis outer membrane usher protein [Caulobacterales bacterium]